MIHMVRYAWLDENGTLSCSCWWISRVLGEKNGEISAEIQQNEPWENENVIFLLDRSFSMAQDDLYGRISLVRLKSTSFLFITMVILCSSRWKWWHFSSKITKMTPWENGNIIFSHLIHFYIALNDLYRQICLIRWRWNLILFISIEITSSRSSK